MTFDGRLPVDPLVTLENEGLSLLVARQGTELYRSYEDGVRPLLELTEWFPGGLDGAIVADRVVGACAARVFDYLQVDQVLGITGSIPAERILHAAAIPFSFRTTVVDIRSRDNAAVCPFEQLAAEHPNPRELVAAIRDRLRELRRKR